jgi:hypothetical protein
LRRALGDPDADDIHRLGCFLLIRGKLVSQPLWLLGLGVAGLLEPSGRQLVLLWGLGGNAAWKPQNEKGRHGLLQLTNFSQLLGPCQPKQYRPALYNVKCGCLTIHSDPVLPTSPPLVPFAMDKAAVWEVSIIFFVAANLEQEQIDLRRRTRQATRF